MLQMPEKLQQDFFSRDVLQVAPELIGKTLCVKTLRGMVRHTITEAEAYRGEDDLACHASKGRTPRTEIMYAQGGHVYVYLIYGMYWMFNIVTGKAGDPQAALIRGINGFDGPGKLTRHLEIDKSYYGIDLTVSEQIWIEDTGVTTPYRKTPRIGIAYAGEPWVSKPWRFVQK